MLQERVKKWNVKVNMLPAIEDMYLPIFQNVLLLLITNVYSIHTSDLGSVSAAVRCFRLMVFFVAVLVLGSIIRGSSFNRQPLHK